MKSPSFGPWIQIGWLGLAVLFPACSGGPHASLGRTSAPPYPLSGAQHPFYRSMDDVILDGSGDEAADGQSRPGRATAFIEAPRTISVTANVNLDGVDVPVTLEATPEVPAEALEYLTKTLRLVPVDPEHVTDLPFFTEKPGPLRAGSPEVRLPALDALARAQPRNFTTAFPPDARRTRQKVYALAWPDGWVMERPYVIRLRPSYFESSTSANDDRGNIDYGLPDPDVGRTTAALTGDWTGVDGVLICDPPDGPPDPLGLVDVVVNGVEGKADASGAFSIDGSFTDVSSLVVRFDGRITHIDGSAAAGPRVSVMNDFHNPRSETVDVSDGDTIGSRLDVRTLTITTLDCELFNHGRQVLEEFHSWSGGGFPPAPDGLRIKRWEDVHHGTPYSYYSYIVLAANFRAWQNDETDPWLARRDTIRHEFGHTFRHAADGGQSHWDWDNFRWAYAREHSGTEVFNEHYAFNEGVAQYWECTVGPFDFPCNTSTYPSAVPGTDFLDWNELRVGARLYDLSQAPGVGHDRMAQLLVDNPGAIHTLMEFERVYCATLGVATYCDGDTPRRSKPDCPPGFDNDGATCRQTNNIRAKPSYGRGAGTLPTGCGSQENDAGLCYTPCEGGFDGVGPVCWQQCPAGMHDDGAFCRRDVSIIASDNSRCPWYDVCGIAAESGCSTCPAGFQNDGCTCRIDAWIFAKDSYGRGAGEIPTDCGPGREYDAGLCYPPCEGGFNGVGPVCWDSCPAGYDDHGATCYRPPNILVRF